MVKSQGTFKFVYIPAEASEPLQEWELSYKNEEDAVQCLLNRVKVKCLSQNVYFLPSHKVVHTKISCNTLQLPMSLRCTIDFAVGHGAQCKAQCRCRLH